MSFTADDAKKITAEYFTTAKENSGDWIKEHLVKVLDKIKNEAGKGHEKCEYAIDLDQDMQRIARGLFLAEELTKLKYTVVLSERMGQQHHRTFTIFDISWATTAT